MIPLLFIISGVAFLLYKGQGQGQATTVINQATGGSLSNALGNHPKPPSYFQSGQPGYTGPVAPVPVIAGPSATTAPTPTSFSIQPGGVVTPRGTVPVAPMRQIVPAISGTRALPPVVVPSRISVYNPATNRIAVINPALTQGTVAVSRPGPEVASPFWASRIRTRKIAAY